LKVSSFFQAKTVGLLSLRVLTHTEAISLFLYPRERIKKTRLLFLLY